MRDEREQYYALLGITPDASKEDLKAAYRKAVKRWHPDIQPDENREYAQEILKQLNLAYYELCKPPPTETYEPQYTFPVDKIKSLINKGSLKEAESLLNTINLRTADWYYLKGLIRARSDSDSAAEYLRTAVSINPTNIEYKRQLRYVLRNPPKGLKNTINRFINDAFDI